MFGRKNDSIRWANEVNNEIRLIKTVQEKHHTDIGVLQKDMQSKPYMNDLVKCDTCRCLLYKYDAIKGESRIVNDDKSATLLEEMMTRGYKDWLRAFSPISVTAKNHGERIQEVYYCHKCNPTHIKETKCPKKQSESAGKSKQTKTSKSVKKSKSRAK